MSHPPSTPPLPSYPRDPAPEKQPRSRADRIGIVVLAAVAVVMVAVVVLAFLDDAPGPGKAWPGLKDGVVTIDLRTPPDRDFYEFPDGQDWSHLTDDDGLERVVIRLPGGTVLDTPATSFSARWPDDAEHVELGVNRFFMSPDEVIAFMRDAEGLGGGVQVAKDLELDGQERRVVNVEAPVTSGPWRLLTRVETNAREEASQLSFTVAPSREP